jgi:hypothetical protein
MACEPACTGTHAGLDCEEPPPEESSRRTSASAAGAGGEFDHQHMRPPGHPDDWLERCWGNQSNTVKLRRFCGDGRCWILSPRGFGKDADGGSDDHHYRRQ